MCDVDNDGCYDILALEKNADRKVLNGWECDLYWLKGSKDMLFKEMPDALIPTQIVQYESSEELNGDAEAYAGDFDNDGFCDILVHSMYFERTSTSFLLPQTASFILLSRKLQPPTNPRRNRTCRPSCPMPHPECCKSTGNRERMT